MMAGTPKRSIDRNERPRTVQLAIDRINEHVSHLYNPFHPAVQDDTEPFAPQKAGIPVSLCGELAGDPLAISLMVGMELTRCL